MNDPTNGVPLQINEIPIEKKNQKKKPSEPTPWNDQTAPTLPSPFQLALLLLLTVNSY